VNRKAFSLIELIISIALLSIIIFFLYSTTSSLQKRNKIFSKKEDSIEKNEKILNLLYDDIFESNELNISGKEYSVLNLQTKSSIFNIEFPNVTWLVSRNNNTLLKFESKLNFSQMNVDNNSYYHISKVAQQCEKFLIYQSKDKTKILIYIKFQDKDPIIYEIPKPLNIKKVPKKKKPLKGKQNPINPHIKVRKKLNH